MTDRAAAGPYDVVVIGAGVVGAVTTWRLVEQGLRVLLLDAGNGEIDRAAFVSRYVRASVKSMGAPYKGTDADRLVPSPDSATDYYDQEGNAEKFKATYRRMLGGSTWHWRGNVPRMLPNDFGLQSHYGRGLDWPLTYEDLEPFYCDAEYLLGVAGDDAEQNALGAIRSRPFPMSRVWPSLGDQFVSERINGKTIEGVSVRVSNTPQARNTQPYDGRPVCTGNSTCDPICPIAAKYDATVHIQKARAQGAHIVTHAVVNKLLADEGGVVRVVKYVDWSGPVPIETEARGTLFVLAAGAIESAKILLMSATNEIPRGLANSSYQVGRNLMDHLQGQVTAMSPIPLYPFRGPPTTSGIDSFRDGSFRKNHSAFRMSVGNDGWGLVEGPYATLRRIVSEQKVIGKALKVQVAKAITHQIRISYSTETLPRAENRVLLSELKDGLDIPRPRIEFSTDDYSRLAFEVAQRAIKTIFEVMGASEIRLPREPIGFSAANHIMGTCRMGTNRKTSVVDTYGRSHDHPNLFILGGSMFPTCATANPTLTIVALALRAMPALVKAARTPNG